MREIFGAIVAMTITLAAVYAPIGFTQGLTGSLFREFAFALAGAVIISGFVAVTVSPMMSGQLLKAARERKPERPRRPHRPHLRTLGERLRRRAEDGAGLAPGGAGAWSR